MSCARSRICLITTDRRSIIEDRLATVDPRQSTIEDRPSITSKIRDEAARLGFSRCRFAAVAPPTHYPEYLRWLDAGHAGDLAYMRAHKSARNNPAQLLPGAKTIICVVANYSQPDMLQSPGDEPSGTIARYAQGRDYHLVMRDKLTKLAQFIRAECSAEVKTRSCVDALPVLERDYAMASGAGFIGKNTLLITPGVGSYTVLGELLVDLALPEDPPDEPRCGHCRLCLDACPTGAIVGEYIVDSRRCISYLTIEMDGPIPRQLRSKIGTMIFGCDRCQEVCPYNANLRDGLIEEFRARADLQAPALIPLLQLRSRPYRRLIKNTALRRVRRRQFLRNVAVALGNLRDARAVPALAGALAEREPLIRGHAAWALGQIGGAQANLAIKTALLAETDSWVREELTLIRP